METLASAIVQHRSTTSSMMNHLRMENDCKSTFQTVYIAKPVIFVIRIRILDGYRQKLVVDLNTEIFRKEQEVGKGFYEVGKCTNSMGIDSLLFPFLVF